MLTTYRLDSTVNPIQDESAPVAVDFTSRDLPHANKHPRSPGRIRCEIADFKVSEELSFSPSDDGEHLLLHVRRSNLTTPDVRGRLAKEFRTKSKNVGYVGLKDKRSIATQWFSVPVETPARSIVVPDIEILQHRRHRKKLRTSDGCQNKFEILVRDIVPASVNSQTMALVPNYFGQQRFGRDGRNVTDAMKWIRKGKPRISPFLKSIYISSLRSYVFNLVLAERVQRGDWRSLIEGDAAVDGVPTGPLWGRGRSSVNGLAKEIEESTVRSVAPVTKALEWVGLNQERRSLAVAPIDLKCEVVKDTALVRFALPTGSYATSVLHECFDLLD